MSEDVAGGSQPVKGEETAGAKETGQDPTGETGEFTAEGENIRIKSVNDLREKAPRMYESMMRSLKSNIVIQMNRFRRNLKRAARG